MMDVIIDIKIKSVDEKSKTTPQQDKELIRDIKQVVDSILQQSIRYKYGSPGVVSGRADYDVIITIHLNGGIFVQGDIDNIKDDINGKLNKRTLIQVFDKNGSTTPVYATGD